MYLLDFSFCFSEISKHYFKNTDIVFETNIKEWFRHGAQRVQRDNKNHD